MSKKIETERYELLEHVNKFFDKPLTFLSFIWLILIILELTEGLSPALEKVSGVIWILFIIDFVMEFVIAPQKTEFLKKNTVVAISLLIPAFRLVRAFRAIRVIRAARAVRSISLVKIVTSLNRTMKGVRYVFGTKKLGFMIILTIIVALTGAAGMSYFERPELSNYGDALWWTSMIMTTIGSDYWPQTLEGRILAFLLSIYAVSIFGYITAAFASWLVKKEFNR